MHPVNWHLKCLFCELTRTWRDRLSPSFSLLPFLSLHFKRTNPAQLPWQSNPCSLFSDAAKYSKPSCCCDLLAIAVPSQVAAFLWEPFQIKAFSQKTLKSRCQQAPNKRTRFLPVSSQDLRWKFRQSINSCYSSVCCDVCASEKRGICDWIPFMIITYYEFLILNRTNFLPQIKLCHEFLFWIFRD